MTRRRPVVRRDFALLDAMLLVAATAVGLAAVRSEGQPGGFWEEAHGRAYVLAVVVTFAANKVLVPISAGWLLARSRRPGKLPRRAWSRPGTVACLTAVVLHSLDMIRHAIMDWDYLPTGPSSYRFFWLTISMPNPESIGRAILIAWLFLAIGGRFRPGRGLFDRLGIAIGLAWIACGLFHAYSRMAQ